MTFPEWVFLERKHGLEMDGETHSTVNYLSCWGYIRDTPSKAFYKT